MMKQISTSRKVLYGMGGLAMNLTNLIIAQWLLKLYAPDKLAVLVPSFLFGLFFTLGRVTDAVTDPLIGFWSDHCRSKRGRRIPFILWGLLPFAVIFFLLWIPPINQLHWFNSVYVFILIQLYFILYTVVVTPYLALIPELTTDLKERVNITTIQAVFILIGTIIFGLIGIVIENAGYAIMGLIISVITIISFAPMVFTIKEKPQQPTEKKEKAHLLKWIALTFRNRPFIFLVIATSFFWFGLNLLLLMVPFWVEHFLQLKQDSTPILMMPFLLMNLVFFFVFNTLAKKIGKYKILLVTFLGSALAAVLLCLVGILPFGDKLLQSAIIMGILGIPIAGFMMLPFAALSDVVDYDEKLTGKRREAIYFGVQALFQKTMIGFSILAFSFIAYIGSDKVTSVLGLKLVIGTAAIFFLISFFIFIKYPLREREGTIEVINK